MKKGVSIINIEGIGNVQFTFKNNAKQYIIKINRTYPHVRVTIPKRGTRKFAINLVTRRKDWIIDKLDNIKQITKIKFGTFVCNNYFILIIERAQTNGNTIMGSYNNKTKEGNIKIPLNADIQKQSTINSFNYIRDCIIKSAAEQILPPILQEVSNNINIPYKKLVISSAKTSWGTCNGKGISLNKNLILLPEHLIKYIMIHELCHLIHLNHQEKFHLLVNEFVNGKEKEYLKQLKMVSREICFLIN